MGKYIDLSGQKFSRLLVLKKSDEVYKRTTFTCLCDCGIKVDVKAESLKDGSTKSCGCLNNEKRSIRAIIFKVINRKFHPRIATARRVFKKRYSDGNLTFEKFLKLTQEKCYYCLSEPNNIANSAKETAKTRAKTSEYAKNEGDFIYNGLDRINSDLPHDLENLVPCCKICNYAKRNMTLNEFKDWIFRIYNNVFKISQI